MPWKEENNLLLAAKSLPHSRVCETRPNTCFFKRFLPLSLHAGTEMHQDALRCSEMLRGSPRCTEML